MNSNDHAAVRAMLDDAEEIARKYFKRVKPQWKSSQSYVTEADYAVQDCIVKWLNAHHPEDGIIAEERDLRREPTSGSRNWIIDPIDGTASFVKGFPTWGIGLALVEDHHPIAAYFACPATNERFSALRGHSAQHNGRIMKVRPRSALNRETILLAFSRMHHVDLLHRTFPGKVRSLGSTIAHAAYAAAGICDVALLAKSMIWDLAPGLLMLNEAGGVMRYLGGPEVSLTDVWDGGPTEQFVLCGHPAMLDLIEQEAFSRY